jgi:NADH-quinone oxidoreductase subunit A
MLIDLHPLGSLAVYAAAALAVAAAMIGLSYILGEKHSGRATGEPYESGLPSIGSAWSRVDVRYYRMAMFFVIFDLESIFIYGWAVAVRQVGWTGYWAIVVFIGTLLAALLYLWKMGALDGRDEG